MTGPSRVARRKLVAGRTSNSCTSAGRTVSPWVTLTHGALAQATIPPPLAGYESRHDFAELLAVPRDELGGYAAVIENP